MKSLVIREERWVEPLFIRVEEGPAEVVQASGQGASLGRCLPQGRPSTCWRVPAGRFPAGVETSGVTLEELVAMAGIERSALPSPAPLAL